MGLFSLLSLTWFNIHNHLEKAICNLITHYQLLSLIALTVSLTDTWWIHKDGWRQHSLCSSFPSICRRCSTAGFLSLHQVLTKSGLWADQNAATWSEKAKFSFYPSLAHKEWAGNKKEPPDTATSVFPSLSNTFSTAEFSLHTNSRSYSSSACGDNSKQSQTKFSDDFAQMRPWRPGHCVHFPGCCAPFLSRKACSPLKTCYLTMMFSSIRGAVKLCSHIP